MNDRRIEVHLKYDVLDYRGEIIRVDRCSELIPDVNITSEMVMKAMNIGNLDDIPRPFTREGYYWKIQDVFSMNFSSSHGHGRITFETCTLFHMVKFVMIRNGVKIGKWECVA